MTNVINKAPAAVKNKYPPGDFGLVSDITDLGQLRNIDFEIVWSGNQPSMAR